jgi:hypothetical protein
MEKVIVDGRVAVVLHSGCGLGWSTCHTDTPEILFDPGIVNLVQEKQWEKLLTYLTLKFPEVAHISGRSTKYLVIHWVRQGFKFRITENDGSERVVYHDDEKWIVA